jgi:hypothetical protein
VEAAPEGVAVVFANDGILSAINIYQSEQMRYLERIPDEESSDRSKFGIINRHKKRIKAWYDDSRGEIDLNAAKRLCSDHEIGLCDHGETKSEPFGTIYSWVAELGTGKMHLAHGRPCENEYKVMKLEVS